MAMVMVMADEGDDSNGNGNGNGNSSGNGDIADDMIATYQMNGTKNNIDSMAVVSKE